MPTQLNLFTFSWILKAAGGGSDSRFVAARQIVLDLEA
jgi:hypothetical protein